jgi:predicted DNA-binding transcriptional regulator YafY
MTKNIRRVLSLLQLLFENPKVKLTTSRIMELDEFSDCSPTLLKNILKTIISYLSDFIDITKSDHGKEDEREIFLFNRKLKDFIIEKHLLEVFKRQDKKLLVQTVIKLKSNEAWFSNEELEIIKGLIDIIKSMIITNTLETETDLNSLLDLYTIPINQFHAYGYIDNSNVNTLLYDLIVSKNTKKICYINYSKSAIKKFNSIFEYFLLPINIYNYNGNIYLDAFTIDKRDIRNNKVILRHKLKERTFALHRITNVEILDFNLPKTLLTKQIEKPNAFGFMHGNDTSIINVNFKPIMQKFIFERNWPGIIKGYPVIIKNGYFKNWIKLKMTGNHIDEICNWLLGFGPNVAVIGDINLKKRYREILNQTQETIDNQDEDATYQKQKNDKKSANKKLKKIK